MDSTAITLALAVGLPLVIAVGALIWMRRETATIRNGIPGDAVVQSITDTGSTISSPSVGAQAPVYRFQMLVTPAGGGAPYAVTSTHAVPRVYIPMIWPGMTMGVDIDPKNPARVVPDWNRLNAAPLPVAAQGAGGGAGAGAGRPAAGTVTMSFDGAPGEMSAAAPGSVPGSAPTLSFDANGVPAAGGVESLVGAVRSGAVPTIRGSFETIIATGTHGTAVITTAMPFGKTAGQVNPAVNPERFNYPVWVFTVEVNLAGQAPFPAVFGHFVPPEKVGQLAPGVKLSVAVDPNQPNQDAAIDWPKSPLA